MDQGESRWHLRNYLLKYLWLSLAITCEVIRMILLKLCFVHSYLATNFWIEQMWSPCFFQGLLHRRFLLWHSTVVPARLFCHRFISGKLFLWCHTPIQIRRNVYVWYSKLPCVRTLNHCNTSWNYLHTFPINFKYIKRTITCQIILISQFKPFLFWNLNWNKQAFIVQLSTRNWVAYKRPLIRKKVSETSLFGQCRCPWVQICISYFHLLVFQQAQRLLHLLSK